MATNRSRRSRDDDSDDDEDDRPRRRRQDDDDEDEDDDRPRSRRRDEDDDDRPRRRVRRDGDEDDRPRRRPRRKARGPSTGLVLGIVGGVVALVAVVAVVVLLATGRLGGASISYAKFEIKAGDTIEGLEKRFGRAKRLEKSEWASVRYAQDADVGTGAFGRGGRGARDATLADVAEAYGIDEWYHWHGGSEDVYVGTGTSHTGSRGPLIKVYTNSNATRENARAGGDFNKMVPSYLVEAIR